MKNETTIRAEKHGGPKTTLADHIELEYLWFTYDAWWLWWGSAIYCSFFFSFFSFMQLISFPVNLMSATISWSYVVDVFDYLNNFVDAIYMISFVVIILCVFFSPYDLQLLRHLWLRTLIACIFILSQLAYMLYCDIHHMCC